jgi:hypothetical protein
VGDRADRLCQRLAHDAAGNTLRRSPWLNRLQAVSDPFYGVATYRYDEFANAAAHLALNQRRTSYDALKAWLWTAAATALTVVTHRTTRVATVLTNCSARLTRPCFERRPDYTIPWCKA